MKKLLTLFTLLFVLLSNFQIGVLHAQNSSQLEIEKNKWVAVLQKVEKVIDITVDKIEKKVKNKEVKERLEEKNEEVKEYLEKVEEEIKSENSKTDIKEKIQEAKKVVVLKVVSWMTKQVDIEDSIDSSVAKTKTEKKEALETIQESLEEWVNYSLIIKTKYSQKKVLWLFKTFDKKVKLDFLYNDETKNYFEVFISKDSIFSQEILEDIKSWNIPESFLWIEIVTPEVFSINSLDLSWEELSKTWWVEKFQPGNYLTEIKELDAKVKVWVIDTGIDYNHPELKWRVSKWRDFVNKDDDAFDDQWHGTHVAWTIWAWINWNWIIWVNPYVELVPLKICNKRWFCPSYAVIKALDYAKEQKIDVLNMSLGWRATTTNHPICSWIKSVTESWIIVVAASWNSNIDTNSFVPGWCEEAITVWAVGQDLYRAPFSNYWNKVDVSAPWVWIYSTLPNNRYRKLSWTSMATPHIVWLISIMKSFDEDLNTQKVKNIFEKNSISTFYENNKVVWGFPNFENILISLNNSSSEVLKEEIKEIEVEEEIKEEVENKEKEIVNSGLLFPTTEDALITAQSKNETEIQSNNEDSLLLFPTKETEKVTIQNVNKSDLGIELPTKEMMIQNVLENDLGIELPTKFDNIEIQNVWTESLWKELLGIELPTETENIWIQNIWENNTDELEIELPTKEWNIRIQNVSNKNIDDISILNSDTSSISVNQIIELNDFLWNTGSLIDSFDKDVEEWNKIEINSLWEDKFSDIENISFQEVYTDDWKLDSLTEDEKKFFYLEEEWDTIDLEENEEEIIETNESINIQNTYHCNMKLNWACSFAFSDANKYQYKSYNWHRYSLNTYSNGIMIFPDVVWYAKLYAYKSWRKVHTFYINITDSARNLRLSRYNITLTEWESSYIKITDWNWWYSVTSQSNRVRARLSGTKVYLDAEKFTDGYIDVDIKDSKWKIRSLMVRVVPKRTITPEIVVEKWKTIEIAWPSFSKYNLTSKYKKVTIRTSSSWLYIIPNEEWNETLYIERYGYVFYEIPVKIIYTKNISVSDDNFNLQVWKTNSFEVLNWNGWYQIYKNNDNVIVRKKSTNSFEIEWVNIWETTLTVKDSKDKTKQIYVKIDAPNYVSSKNWLLRNWNFEGDINSNRSWWLWWNHNLGWYSFNSKLLNTTKLQNNSLELAIDWGYIEVKSAWKDYTWVTPDSIKVKPNTKYTIEYDYETKHISWESSHWFTVAIIWSESNNKWAWTWKSQDFTKSNKSAHIKYEFITDSNTNYINIIPLIYGHTWAGTLKMKATIKNMSFIKSPFQSVKIEEKNWLVRNWKFEGNTTNDKTWWIGWNTDLGWYSFIEKSWNTASIKNNTLELSIDWGYIETRNSGNSYFWVTDNSIKVEPNTHYIVKYDYKTEYISWDSSHWFSVLVLWSESNNKSAGWWRTQGFVKTSKTNNTVEYKFKTESNTNYINIWPLLYWHTWAGNLKMKAFIKNVSLVKNSVQWISYISKKNGLLRNWSFEWNIVADKTWWIGWNNNSGWHTFISKNWNKASLKNGSLELETNWWYIEVKNSWQDYYWVTSDSIKVEPNTKYIVEYDYETKYISWNSSHWFTVMFLWAESHKKDAGSWKSQSFTRTNKKGHIKYEFTTKSNTKYINVIPAIYSHTGEWTLKMKAILKNMSFIKSTIQSVRVDTKNWLIRNGNFEWNAKINRTWWIGWNSNLWWSVFISKTENKAEVKNNALELEVDWWYIEARNTTGWYFGVTEDSIKIEPNSTYIIEYDYETQYLGWDSSHGFTLGLLLSKENNVASIDLRTIPYTKISKSDHVKYRFTTSSNANYLNISPLIYWHTGEWNLKMKAIIKNMSLVKEDIRIEDKNGLVRNGKFDWNGTITKTSWVWGNSNLWWFAFLHKEGKVELKDNSLTLETNGGYIEARNTNWWYFWITDDSILVEPNTSYTLEFDYQTEKLWWNANHWFTVWILGSTNTWGYNLDLKAIPYINTSKWKTHVSYEFTTNSETKYINISPIIYGHTGDGNLRLRAKIWDVKVVKQKSFEKQIDDIFSDFFNEYSVNLNHISFEDFYSNNIWIASSKEADRCQLW